MVMATIDASPGYLQVCHALGSPPDFMLPGQIYDMLSTACVIGVDCSLDCKILSRTTRRLQI